MSSESITTTDSTPTTPWCKTCGNPVEGEGKRCNCWILLADALQRYLGMGSDTAADAAADLWEREADKEYVWSAEYADDHDLETYPDERAFAPAHVRYQGFTLTEIEGGKVQIMSDRPDALPVVRNCMEHAKEFVDVWTLSPEDFATKYGRQLGE